VAIVSISGRPSIKVFNVEAASLGRASPWWKGSAMPLRRGGITSDVVLLSMPVDSAQRHRLSHSPPIIWISLVKRRFIFHSVLAATVISRLNAGTASGQSNWGAPPLFYTRQNRHSGHTALTCRSWHRKRFPASKRANHCQLVGTGARLGALNCYGKQQLCLPKARCKLRRVVWQRATYPRLFL
jgi:hypothetical protein